ncbi:helix-turn-helix domain-containing protein [Chelativorans composti]|uniref:Helix-turn-helix domain-containing protein n=1 Tax=Chelativorans composti TaxID=768533 RepID=A0ABW5DL40_9HYPH
MNHCLALKKNGVMQPRGGVQAVPDILLKQQGAMGLSATDLVVLLNILMYWWYVEQKPYPRPTTIAKRMDVNVRTVQRSLQRMEELGLIVRSKTPEGSPIIDPMNRAGFAGGSNS